jgi:hypothetical protein
MKTLLTRLWLSNAAPLPVAALLALAPSIAACADENDPATWAKRLEDPAQRSVAISRLSGMFEKIDADLKREKKDETDPRMQEYLNKAVEPLTKQYTGSTLDDKTRKELIKFISDLRDPRTMPAFVKAFKELEAGKNEEDARFAAVAMTSLAKEGKVTDQTAIDALWDCFAKLKHSATKSEHTAREIQNALLAVKHASYGPKATAMLGMEVNDPKDPTENRDKILFWQSVSLRVINELKFSGAARAIVKVILTPKKGDLRALANKAVMLMPKEAEPLLVSALNGTDPEFAKLAEDFGPEKNYLPILTQVLGQLSRPAGREATLAALPKATSDGQRAAMVESLVAYPIEKRGMDIFLATYAKTPVGTKKGGEANARAGMTEAAAMIFDKSLTPWLLKEIAASKGDEAVELQGRALRSAIKVMGPEHAESVSTAVGKFGTKDEREMYEAAQKALQQCKEDAACYLKILEQPIPTVPPTAKFIAVKACWMAAMYGNDKTGVTMVALLEKVKDDTVRLSMAQAIDHLFPKGDEASAKSLEKMVEQNVAAGKKSASDDILINIAYKLRARALP